jgi:hypothetical protein
MNGTNHANNIEDLATGTTAQRRSSGVISVEMPEEQAERAR